MRQKTDKHRTEQSVQEQETLRTFLEQESPKIAWLFWFVVLLYSVSLFGKPILDDVPGFIQNTLKTDLLGSFSTLRFQDSLYAISYHLFGNTLLPLHLTSVILHAINAILVFVIASQITKSRRIGIFTAVLFASHPINTEAVAWVSSINYLISGTFFFSSVLALSIYKRTGLLRYLYLSILLLLANFYATRSGWELVSIGLLFIVNLTFFSFDKRKLIIEVILFFVAASVTAFLTYGMYQARAEDLSRLYVPSNSETSSIFVKIPTAYVNNLLLLTVPFGLSVFHEGNTVPQQVGHLFLILTLLGFVVTGITLKKSKLLGGLALIMILGISVQALPVNIAWILAERYLYIPSFAFCTLLVIAVDFLSKRYLGLPSSKGLLVLIIVVFSLRSFIRTFDWLTPKNFWSAEVRVSPFSPRTHAGLGDVYAIEKNYPAAFEELSKATQLAPENAEYQYNLGQTYYESGDYENAKIHLGKAIDLDPNLYQAYANIAGIYFLEGDKVKAKEYATEAIRLKGGSYGVAEYILQLVESSD